MSKKNIALFIFVLIVFILFSVGLGDVGAILAIAAGLGILLAKIFGFGGSYVIGFIFLAVGALMFFTNPPL